MRLRLRPGLHGTVEAMNPRAALCSLCGGGAGTAVNRLEWLAAAGSRRGAAAATLATAGTSRGKEETHRMYDDLKQKFGYLGALDHSKVGARDLFRVLRAARSPADYRIGLQTMNLFYNFGVKLKHRQIASRLLAAAMVCKVESEAVELIKLYGTWLQHPPETALVYAVMGHFLDAGEPMVVREVARAVREDWRMPTEPPLYVLSIEAMLQLPERGLEEAMLLHSDARLVGVRLPAPLHVRLLNEGLRSFEALLPQGRQDPEAAGCSSIAVGEEGMAALHAALAAADGLARDGHLRGGASAASMCSLAWLFWHLERLSEAAKNNVFATSAFDPGITFQDSDWRRALRAAIENFGCHWGFSAQLPIGFFQALEASKDPEVASLVKASQQRFGRFYPAKGG